jgi:dTDP-4-dehydrorhamnose reductase
MKQKVLILGAAGMAGHIITAYLKNTSSYDVITIARENQLFIPDFQLDVTNFDELSKVIQQTQPDFIINCIGILNRDAEDNIDKAILINAYLPHYLETITKHTSTQLIHISTDCVFSGTGGNYKESDVKDGKGYYAQSKALGEVINDKDLTIRTSIIGPELKNNGIGLLGWFLKQSGEVRGYTQAIWSGVTTLELAKYIYSYLQGSRLSGILHLTNNRPISKFDLLEIIKKVYQLNAISVVPYADYQSNKSFINTRVDVNYTVPDYQVMIEELKNWERQFSKQ